MAETIRVPFEEMEETLFKLLAARGVNDAHARTAARNFTQNSADGVPSHGMNRVVNTVEKLDRGDINGNAEAEVLSREGAQAVLEGHFGLGSVNAVKTMDLACDLAAEHGIGIAAIRNTNHWLRGGAYGWQAANRGFIGICWSNTCPNMVPWGGEVPAVGNNPLVLSVPRENGRHAVLDFAMSQFSYGAMQNAAATGKAMPFPAGWDEAGSLTEDPTAVLKSSKALPMGYWKGSGLAVLLDLVGALASGGSTTTEVGRLYENERGLTQVMIALKPAIGGALAGGKIEETLAAVAASAPKGGEARYPGQREYKERLESMEKGVKVDKDVWASILAL